MLALPLATDPIKLADWVELSALVSSDRNASMGDLSSTLATSSVLEDGDEVIEPKMLAVFHELEARSVAAAEAYPFTLSGTGVVTAREVVGQFSAYVFCLCLSYTPVVSRRGQQIFPYRLFEDLAVAAARNFVGGEAVRFASPRSDLPRRFGPALTEVCARMEEGSLRTRSKRGAKDSKLDVVAWRHFPDRLPGKLLLFGQCAAGNEWEDKLGELVPQNFCEAWLSEMPASPRVKAFFIPHRVNRAAWEDAARGGGIFFDRCRLAYWANTGAPPTNTEPYIQWVETILSGLA